MAFTPTPVDFEELMLEFHTSYRVNELSVILARYQLQDFEYTSSNEHFVKFEKKCKTIEGILLSIRKAGNSPDCHESVDKLVEWTEGNSYELEKVTEKMPCIKLSEFATWANENKNFKCPQVILDKATVPPGSNQNIGKREPDAIESSPDIIDQAAKGHENVEIVQETEIAHNYKTPAAKAKSTGRVLSNFTKLVTHVFNKLPKLNKLNLAKTGKTREFIILIKEMAAHNNPLADSYVMDVVKSISIPDEGLCTITMNDDSKLFGDNELRRKGREYNNHNVSQVLSRLRKKLAKNNI